MVLALEPRVVLLDEPTAELTNGRPMDRRARTRHTHDHGIRLEVVRLPEAKKGFVLLPRRWVVERSFAWATRFRRLVKDYERYPSTLEGLHIVAFVSLMLSKAAQLAAGP